MKKFDKGFVEEMKSKLDIDLVGVVSVEISPSEELRRRAIALLPGVKSVMVFGKEIYGEVLSLLKPSRGVGEPEDGALLGPHNDYLSGRLSSALYSFAKIFRKEGYRSLPLPPAGCPMDQRFLTSVFSYKHAGELAGLGTIGKHSLLITPQYGPRVRLACLLTEASLESLPPGNKNRCVNCNVCIEECPAQALSIPQKGEAYSLNKFACMTYRQPGLTCGICMKVCGEALS
jgi:epoxyqueuosine reductase